MASAFTSWPNSGPERPWRAGIPPVFAVHPATCSATAPGSLCARVDTRHPNVRPSTPCAAGMPPGTASAGVTTRAATSMTGIAFLKTSPPPGGTEPMTTRIYVVICCGEARCRWFDLLAFPWSRPRESPRSDVLAAVSRLLQAEGARADLDGTDGAIPSPRGRHVFTRPGQVLLRARTGTIPCPRIAGQDRDRRASAEEWGDLHLKVFESLRPTLTT